MRMRGTAPHEDLGTLTDMAREPLLAHKLRHVRPAQPLHFPAEEPWEEHLGQSPRHYRLGMVLHTLLVRLCGEAHSVGADVFVYWNASDNRFVRAPDACIKFGLPAAVLREERSWKTWELGVPELAVEILSLSDTQEKWTLDEKRESYDAMGVREFVCFDVDAPEGRRLRVWDRVEGDFVERVVEGDRTPSVTLSLGLGKAVDWIVAPEGIYPATLRILVDGELAPSPDEERAAAAREKEAALRALADAKEQVALSATQIAALSVERDAAQEAARLAEERIAELEAKLRER